MAFCETVGMTTYYPAPNGRYKSMAVVAGLTMEKTASVPGVTGAGGNKYVWYTDNSNNLSLAVSGDNSLFQITPTGAVKSKGRLSGACVQITYGTEYGTTGCTGYYNTWCAYDAAKPELGNLNPLAPPAFGFYTCCKDAASCN